MKKNDYFRTMVELLSCGVVAASSAPSSWATSRPPTTRIRTWYVYDYEILY